MRTGASKGAQEPSIAVIVPACNEEADIRQSIESLAGQDYGNLHIIVVDDRSTDSTPGILDQLAREYPRRISALHVRHLPPGWLGKTHAMDVAVRYAETALQPEWLLFTDADVYFAPEAIRRSMSAALALGADHFVMLPTTISLSAGEAVMLAYLQVMGLWAVRLWRVPDANAPDAIGLGAFGLIRSPVYRSVGGYAGLRMAVVEDVSLGRRIKSGGFQQNVAFGRGLVRLHWANGAFGIVNVMTKNLFAVVGFRVSAAIAACLGLGVLWLAPIFGLAIRRLRLPAAVTLLAIGSVYRSSTGFSGMPRWTMAGFPVATVLLIYSMLRSMAVTIWSGGVMWRGTLYPLGELRQNFVSLVPARRQRIPLRQMPVTGR